MCKVLLACLSPNISQIGETRHGSACVLNSEPEAKVCSSALRFEAEGSASGVPETTCRDPRACLVATRPRGVNAAIRNRFSRAEDDAVRTRPRANFSCLFSTFNDSSMGLRDPMSENVRYVLEKGLASMNWVGEAGRSLATESGLTRGSVQRLL